MRRNKKTSKLSVEYLEDRRMLSGNIIVRMRDGYDAGELEADYARNQLAEQQQLAPHIYLMSATPTLSTIAKLNKDPRVLYAERNYQISLDTLLTEAVPNDARFIELWGMHNTGANGGRSDADIDAPEAWDEFGTGSSSVIAVIIDTGIDYTHPDLADNMWRNPGEVPGNGVDDDQDGFIDNIFGVDTANNDGDPIDDGAHGTHVSGTVAARGGNGIGVAGVAWNVKLAACKFLTSFGSGTYANAIRCFDWVNQLRARGENVVVTNNSWSGVTFSQALQDVMSSTTIIHAVSAGNSACNNDIAPRYPAAYPLDNLITVAASDSRDNYASFTCFGRTTVDLAAPGVGILSAWPTSFDPVGYRFASGTSMAAPHVAGTVAMLKSVSPSLTVQQAKDRVLNGVDRLNDASKPTVSNGRLNLFGALRGRDDPPDPPPTPTIPVLSVGDVTFDERNDQAFTIGFTVRLSRNATSPVTFEYITSDGTATEGSDYTMASGTGTIPVGRNSVVVSVTVTPDRDNEPDETFFLDISDPDGATVGDGRGVATIRDDDSTPRSPPRSPTPTATLSIADATIIETDDSEEMQFVVTLSEVSTVDVVVDYRTKESTARHDSDFHEERGVLVVPAGELTATIVVQIVGDDLTEPVETFGVQLSNADGARIADNVGIGTITDDDTSDIAFTISDATVVRGGIARITITLSAPALRKTWVRWRTHEDTAESGRDFRSARGSALFQIGQTTKTIMVRTKRDNTSDPRQFFIRLSRPVGASILDDEAVVTILPNAT